MGAEVVAEGQMSSDVLGALFVDVNMVGSGAIWCEFLKISAGFNAEFAFCLVAEGRHSCVLIDGFDVCDLDKDVDYGFGQNVGNGGAADMVDGDGVGAEGGFYFCGLGGELGGPIGVMGDD